jgi:multisubunit Na+/H+ antiporter MnhF subunit
MAARLPIPGVLAGGVLLAGIAAAARKPVLALALIVVLAMVVPFIILPVRLGAAPPVISVLLTAVVGVSFVEIVRGCRPAWRDRVLGLQAIYLGLILVATVLALPWARDIEPVQAGLKLALAAAVPALVVMWVRQRELRRYGPVLIISAAAIQAVFAVVLHVAAETGVEFLTALAPAGYPSANIQRFLPDQFTARATGLLVDPNVLGVTLAMATPFVIVDATSSKRMLVLRTAVLILVITALALTLSRGAWIGAALAVTVVIASTRPRLGPVIVLSGIVLLLPVWTGGSLASFRAAVLERDVSNALRVDEFREALRVIGRYPWFGVGYGDAPDTDVFIGVSNTWLWIAERAGIFAALSAAAAVAGALVRALRLARVDPLARASAAGLVALVAASMVDQHLASFPHLVALGGALVGATLVATRPQA